MLQCFKKLNMANLYKKSLRMALLVWREGMYANQRVQEKLILHDSRQKRQTSRHTDKQTDRLRHRHITRQTDIETHTVEIRPRMKQTDRLPIKHTDREKQK